MLPLVNILVQKYEQGPISNPKVHNKPYLAYLGEDLAKLTKDMKHTMSQYEEEHSSWVGYEVFPPQP